MKIGAILSGFILNYNFVHKNLISLIKSDFIGCVIELTFKCTTSLPNLYFPMLLVIHLVHPTEMRLYENFI